ncbi:MAG: dihydropteroate synthase [Defluviitaleaceae bacterium]|nr:dihydropteroate synthase [Defluviitaleaceae bacterium]
MQIGKKNFNLHERTFIVGILNVTPDSFFDGGAYNSLEQAVNRAKKMVADGADIIEIGGESSRPGFTPVDAQTEMERILPILKAVNQAIDIPIAIDTYKSEVAEAALQNGAVLINDIFCFKRDPELPKVCAKYNAACCIMHNRDDTSYDNILLDIITDLNEGIDRLLSAGVAPQKIITDPGIGFAKDTKQSIHVLRNLSYFTALPYPVMLGASRKSFIGNSIGLPVEDRLEATIATTVLAIHQNCSFIRVHDVKENKRAAMIADVLIRNRGYVNG